MKKIKWCWCTLTKLKLKKQKMKKIIIDGVCYDTDNVIMEEEINNKLNDRGVFKVLRKIYKRF